ncbi:MAG: FMN-binding protein [Ruminococcaceae bacterium]|nr:FMN-binding protein [Oscillospiraceae bacterium]
MKKQNIMPIAVLTSICVIVALLLGGVNELTKDKIAENALKKEQASLIEVLPDSVVFDEIDISQYELPVTVKSAYRETSDKGYVLIMATKSQYSTEDMTISVGIYPDGSVAGVKLTNYKESKDFGKTTYPNKYVGTTADTYDDVEVTTGVTISSNAFKAAIGDAISAAATIAKSEPTAYAQNCAALLTATVSEELPKTDSELIDLTKKLVGGLAFTEEKIPEDAPATLKKLYKAADEGYVAYIIVPGQYVPIATEALIHIDSLGFIKNVNLLSWVVGHGVEPGDFANEFIEKDIWHMGKVELVTGATGTSEDFFNAVDECLEYFTDFLGVRESGYATLLYKTAGYNEVTEIKLPKNAPDTLKTLYSVKSGGYLAHIVVPGQYVPVATEALMYVDSQGTIKKVDLLEWIVGHGVGQGDFETHFTGKNIWKMNKVELVSGATGTSQDFYEAVKATLDVLASVMENEEQMLIDYVSVLIPNSGKIEKLELPKDAPNELKALYKDTSGKGSVAHFIVAGQYVPVASEALVVYNEWGEIVKVELLEWVVGHGIGPGDFADRFVGMDAENIAKVELVADCTTTSGDLKAAIEAAFPYIPTSFPTLRIVGIAVLTVSISVFVAFMIISKKRRTAK